MRRVSLGVLLISSLLIACGGGGGGSSGSSSGGGGGSSSGGGGGGNSAGAFTIDRTSIDLTASRQSSVIAQLPVNVTITGSSVAAIAAGYRAGVSPADWLQIHVASGSILSGRVSLNFVCLPGTLANGTYRTTVTITSRDFSGNDLIGRDVDVAYTVRDGVGFASSIFKNLQVIEGSPQAQQNFTVNVLAPANVSWRATSDVSWLSVPTTTFTGPQTITIAMNVDGRGPTGFPTQMGGMVHVTNTADSTDIDHGTFFVEIQDAQVTVDGSPLVLGHETGLEYEPIKLPFSLNTGTRAHPFIAIVEMATGTGLVHSSVTSGTVSAAGAELSIQAVQRATTAPGTYTGTLHLQVQLPFSRLNRDIPITYNVEQNRLFVESAGVAFSKFPSRSVLTRAVRVHDTQALNTVAWQAASNRSWLTVTPSGTTGQDVALTADPTGLAEGQYEGEITLTTTDALTTGTQTIRVGLTVRSADPPASVTLPVTNSARSRTNPVDPEFYSAEGNFVRSYDVYSGALIRTIADLGEEPYALAVSDDGRVVYALLDAKTTESRVIAIRPSDGTVLNTLLLPYNGFTSSNEAKLAYARPDGRPFVISSIAGAYDLTAGAPASSFAHYGLNSLISPDYRRVFTSETSLYMYTLRYSSLTGLNVRELANSFIHDRDVQGDTVTSVSEDGLRLVYSADPTFSGLLYRGRPLRALSILNTTFASETERSGDGRFAALAYASNLPPYSELRIWVFDANRTKLGELSVTPSLSAPWPTIAFSGDGTRIVSNAYINFQNSIKILSAP